MKRRLQALHNKLCQELGIPPVKIEFSPVWGEDTPLGSYECQHNILTVHLKTIKEHGADARSTVAHETYHHYQRVTGMMDENGDWFQGCPRTNHGKPWSQQPWERGAIRYQKKIKKREGWK